MCAEVLREGVGRRIMMTESAVIRALRDTCKMTLSLPGDVYGRTAVQCDRCLRKGQRPAETFSQQRIRARQPRERPPSRCVICHVPQIFFSFALAQSLQLSPQERVDTHRYACDAYVDVSYEHHSSAPNAVNRRIDNLRDGE